MDSLPHPAAHHHNRRAFLISLAGATLAARALAWRTENDSENLLRFVTPECEIKMSVEYYGSSELKNLRFRDSLTSRAFCLTANGTEDSACQTPFSGSLAIAHYHFRSRAHAQMPLQLRERVLTIDHDSRMDPRPPFEKLLAIQHGMASDIQAFGYNPATSPAQSLPVWCLLRQDLFLNDQPAAFLTVHWKHTFGAITLLDVIPGDSTAPVAS